MARKKSHPVNLLEIYERIDAQARNAMQNFIADLREAQDPDLELKTQTIIEFLGRLSTHHMELFDEELEAVIAQRKKGE